VSGTVEGLTNLLQNNHQIQYKILLFVYIYIIGNRFGLWTCSSISKVKMVSVQDASKFDVDEHNFFSLILIHSILFVVSLSFVSPLSLSCDPCMYLRLF
jgi:hypothetical protein